MHRGFLFCYALFVSWVKWEYYYLDKVSYLFIFIRFFMLV